MVSKQLLKDALGWGFLLWLFGYVLGIVFFMVMPSSLVGWVILPIGLVITVWVLLKKISGKNFHYYVRLALAWTFIAIIFDYFFLVKIFQPADGYYKLDVYVYYILTFSLPLIVGWSKSKKINL